jgi:hypothetical protein
MQHKYRLRIRAARSHASRYQFSRIKFLLASALLIRPQVSEGVPTCQVFECIALAAHSARPPGQLPDARPVTFDTDSDLIGIDNRCSACLSSRKEDFDGPLVDTNISIRAYGGARIKGNIKRGTMVLQWFDNEDFLHEFRIPNSYYVPDIPGRLLSPQHWIKAQQDTKPHPRGTYTENFADCYILYWGQRQHKLVVPVDPATNCFTFSTAPGYTSYETFCKAALVDDDEEEHSPLLVFDSELEPSFVSDDEDDDANETSSDIDNDDILDLDEEGETHHHVSRTQREAPAVIEFDLDGPTEARAEMPIVIEDEEDRIKESPSAEFLRYHHRFGHCSMKKIRLLALRGILPRHLANCPIPCCTACLYGQAQRRPWRTKPTKEQLKRTPLKPGDCVSVDQMISPTPGLIAQMIGRPTTARYKVATIFVDSASRYSFVWLQKSTSADDTVEAKIAFERHCADQGIIVRHYNADNGVFASHKWKDDCKAKVQGLSFTGVNAHHQNGIAEKRIGDLQRLSRSMLIHANRRWPTAINAHLWPYAVRMACDSINSTPSLQRKDAKSPVEVFWKTGATINPRHFKHFGCPVYTLTSELQAMGPFHKWKERADVGVYLGRSPLHARAVALVLSLKTGLVSPQFHVKFDSEFQTVRKSMGNEPPVSLWQAKCGFVVQPKGIDAPPPIVQATDATDAPPGFLPTPLEGQTGRIPPEPVMPTPISQESPTPPQESAPSGEVHPQEPTTTQWQPERAQARDQVPPARMSTRNRRPVERLIQVMKAPFERVLDAMKVEIAYRTRNAIEGELFCLSIMFPIEQEQDPIIALKASTDPDTMYWHQAMKQPDKAEFVKAAQKEVEGQVKNGNFSIIERAQVPEGASVLSSVWAMKRKRRITTGEVYKHKARLNLDGSKQVQGRDFDESYSPVATWSSIRTLLTIGLLKGWKSRQIDFVAAYTQAPVERDTYMELPRGFVVEGRGSGDFVLKIHRNLYGGKSAGRVWNEYLVDKLKKAGFVQSQQDDCVFYKGRSVYVLYVDDSILTGPDEQELDAIIQEMKAVGLDLTVEGDVSDFIGVNIEKKADGTIHLTQPELMKSILTELRLEEGAKIKDIPAASSKLLSRHPTSPSFDGHFGYRRIVGKLNFLEKSTRPDLSYASHQCARFSSDPKREHGNAIKWLGRYLLGTKDKGLIYRPKAGKGLELWVDASFLDNWDPEIADEDRDTARSRYGYVVKYEDCPIMWASKLQTEIALSTTEAEYIGLSHALRQVIPMMELLNEMKLHGVPIEPAVPEVHCKVFEDNSGALEMAKVPKVRPRTKFLNVKLHHFRSWVERKALSLFKCTTEDQQADIFNKALSVEPFKRHRFSILGW